MFFRSKDIIRAAIKDNDFLTNLETLQVRELVDVMYEQSFKKGDYIVREGEPGQHLYVIEGNYIFEIFCLSTQKSFC